MVDDGLLHNPLSVCIVKVGLIPGLPGLSSKVVNNGMDAGGKDHSLLNTQLPVGIKGGVGRAVEKPALIGGNQILPISDMIGDILELVVVGAHPGGLLNRNHGVGRQSIPTDVALNVNLLVFALNCNCHRRDVELALFCTT